MKRMEMLHCLHPAVSSCTWYECEATISIYNPGEECGILFCNVAAYDVHGNPLLILDDGGGEVDDNIDRKQCKKIQQYDQLTPLPGETASKEGRDQSFLLQDTTKVNIYDQNGYHKS